MSVIVGEFRSGEWQKSFKDVLKRHPFATQSFENLKGEGFKEAALVRFLYEYSHPSSVKAQRATRKWAAALAKQLAKTEKLMRKSADDLESCIDRVELGFATQLQTFSEKPTVHTLRTAAECVGNLREHYKRVSSQKGKARDEEQLVYLCLLVEGATGRPHWEDLAYLLDAAFAAHGENEDWDEDALRKVVTRFRKQHPKAYADMRNFLVDSRQGEAKPTALKRSTRTRRANESAPSSPAGYLDEYVFHPARGGREDDE
jgi:hypothetical protein